MRGFVRDPPQIEVDGGARQRMGGKPLQLGVMAITLSRSSEHRARQQALPPQRDQALSVKIPRVKCPQTHRQFPNAEVARRDSQSLESSNEVNGNAVAGFLPQARPKL
jgi:hypothetical protein